MKVVPNNKVVYSFSPNKPPVEYAKLGEDILLETEDALGGQIKNQKTSLEQLDWSEVDGATGPIFIEGVAPGDTLVVNIKRIKIESRGVMIVVPTQGALGDRRRFKTATKIVEIKDGYFDFNGIKMKVNPMIGTIGVTPEKEVPTATLGRHGGNIDAKDMVAGTRLFLPVFVKGALFAAGDLHAIQADGEACVSAVEVPGQLLLSFDVIKERIVSWPVLETEENYLFLTCSESLDEAGVSAVETAVETLMRQYDWPFEEAYMFASLVVDLRINQVVDPKKGVRAAIPRNLISVESLYSQEH